MSPLSTWVRRLRYYGLALLLVGGAVLLRWLLPGVLRPAPSLVFYLAWVGAAAFGGLGPGLLATVASWLCIELLFDFTPGHIGFVDPASMARLLVFLAGGLAISVVGEGMRRVRIRERRQGRELADMNAALRASADKYRFLVENSKDIIGTIDLQGKPTFVSGNVEKMTGYRADEISRMILWDLLAPECHNRVKEKLRRHLRGEDVSPYELLAVGKDGRRVPFEVVMASIVDDGGNIVGVQGVCRDITERQRAEAALRASEEKYRFLVENSKDVTWIIDLQSKWQFISSNIEKVTGYRADELIGQTIWGLLAPECHDLARENMRRRVQGEELPPYEVVAVGKDGRRTPFEVYAGSVIDDGGNVVGVQGVARDITERKRAEEALRASEEKYRFLVENSKDITWTIDLQGRWTFVSSNVEKVTGYRADEIIGRTIWDFLAPECHDLVREKLDRRLHGEDLPPYEVLIVGKDGRRTPFELHAVTIVDDGGNVVGVQGVSRDITERRRAEEALRASEEKYRLLVENSKDITWMVDLQGRWTFVSSNVEKVTGYRADEIIGQTIWDLLAPECRDLVQDKRRRRLRGEDLPPYEVMFVGKDGRHWPFEVVTASVIDDGGNVVGVQGVARDITERKQAEQDLRESRDKYQALIETTADFIWEMDTSGRYTYCSPQMKDLWGYEPKDMIGKTPFDVMPPEDRKQALASFMALAKSPQPFTGLEASSYDRRGRLIAVEISGVPFFDADGRLLGYRGISRDITERKRAQEALRASQESLALAQEIAHLGNWSWDLRTDEQEWSDESFRIFGFEPGECQPNRDLYLGLLHPEDRGRILTCWSDALERNIPFNMDYRIIRRDGSVRHVHSEGQIVRDDEGQPSRVFGINQDITERKRAEEALRASQSMLQSVMENVPQGIFWKDRQSTYLGCNNVFAQATGLKSPGDIIGKTDYDLPWLPEQTASFREYDGRIMENDAPEYHIIEQMREADGKLAWVETNKVPLHDSQGHVVGILGTYEDITERKQAEDALAESRKKYRGLVEKINDWVWEIDANGVYTYVSPRARELLGYAPEEIVGKTPFDLMPPAEAQRVWNAFEPIWLGRKPLELLDNTLVRKDGRLVTVETSGMPVFAEDGTFLGYTGIDRDVTARKQAEEALRESEEKFRLLAETSPAAILIYQDGAYVYANRAAEAITGYQRAELLAQAPGDVVHPDYRRQVRQMISRRAQGEGPPMHYELKVLTKDGQERWMDSTTVSIAYGNKPAGLVVAFDVTERKQAEEALRKSEEKFAKAFRSSPVAIAVTRLHDGRILDANEAMLKLLHFTADEVIGHTTRDLDIWVDVNDRAQFTQMLATAGPVRDLEYRLRTKDGAIVTIHLSAELLEVSGEPCMLSTLVDVTERQRAAEALRQEKTFTDKLLNAPRDTVFLFEPATGQPVRWNKRFAEVSGYDDDEIAGMKAPDDFYDESDLRKAREAMVKIATGGQGVVELSLVTKRGVHIPFEYAATVVETEDGRTLLLSIGRDITERKQAEQALRELNATLETRVAERTAELEHRARQLQKLTLELTEAEERERQRLAEILHDDLQQVLAAAKFHVGLLDGRVRDDTESQEIVGQARDLLVDAITKSRSLSHELSAPVLSRSDLCEAFEWLAEQMQTKHRFTVHLDLGGRMELASEPLRVLLYKAAQELLFNAIKHAGVHEATLRLRHRRGRTWLFVSDQGRGFDSRGLGKASGFGLLSIRERVEYLGGRLKIRSVPGKGSIFAVAVPDSDVRESAFPREAPSAPSGAPATEE